jgi:hypothetical protein
MRYLFVVGLLLVSAIVNAETMTQSAMEKIVAGQVEVLSQKKGYLVFKYKEVKMALISDVKHDRMRIISPVAGYPGLTAAMKDAAMEANFHSALDARYGVSKDVLYSAFIHPLSPLTKQELESALNQVASLAKTFGSTFTSGTLTFGGKNKKPKQTSADIGV